MAPVALVMPKCIGLYGPDECPLARTAGFRQELVRVKDGDSESMNVPQAVPSTARPARDNDPVEY